MLFQKLTVITALSAGAVAQIDTAPLIPRDISQDDIPPQCTAICAEVVSIAQQCDRQHENDNAELQCICSATNANTLIPTCEACVTQFDVDTDDDDLVNDNDVREVLTRCNFSTTTYNSASVNSLAASISSSAVSAASASHNTPSATITSASGTVVVVNSVAPATATDVARGAGNAAPAPTAAAAIGIGALGLAFGML